MLENIVVRIVTRCINAWDPMDLLSHAPEDEYEDEIRIITKVVLNSLDEIEIAEDIKDTFDYSFQSNFNFDDCLDVAKKIWVELYE